MSDVPAPLASTPAAPRDAAGGPARVDEARTAAELRRLRAFFENAQVGIAVTSADGTLLEVNDRLCAMLGYSREELTRTTWAAITHPDDISGEISAVAHVLRGETDHAAVEKRYLCKDGGSLWALLAVSAVRDARGAIDYVVGFVNDIGARKQAEEALRESETRFRRLFEGHRAVMLVLDPQTGRILDANGAAVDFYGWSLDELRAMRVGDINTLPPDELARALGAARRGERTHFEFRHRRADGSERDVDVYSNVVDLGGRASIYSIVHDVTDRRRAERERDRAEIQNRQLVKAESLGRMASAIAHHFNNQLHVVLANLELAQLELDGEPRGRGEIRAAEDAARKAAELGELMRTYMGRRMAERRPVDLSAACAAAVQSLATPAHAAATFDLALATPGPVVVADPRTLEEAVAHLVTNAVEALEDGPRAVRVAVGSVDAAEVPTVGRFPVDFEPEPGPYACIEVEDTGRGVAALDVERLFDPFFTTKQLGRGLGLPVVLGFVRAERGAVAVERRQDRGTRFRLFLPAADNAPRAPRPRATRPPQPAIDATTTRRFVEALVAGDAASSHALVVALLDRGVGARAIGRDLFRDALRDIGERWARGLCDVGTEHRATAIVESLLPLVFPPGATLAKNGRRALVACPAGERHALGARIVGHFLARRGWEVASLGQDTPADALVAEATRARPDLVAISVSVAAHLGAAIDAVEAVRAAGVAAPVVLGGDGVRALEPARLARARDVHAMPDLAALEARLPAWERA